MIVIIVPTAAYARKSFDFWKALYSFLVTDSYEISTSFLDLLAAAEIIQQKRLESL